MLDDPMEAISMAEALADEKVTRLSAVVEFLQGALDDRATALQLAKVELARLRHERVHSDRVARNAL